MQQANLKGASFRQAGLAFVDLEHTNLYGADFTGAVLYRCNLRKSRGKK
ncbi:MAG: pentapeptide repeat-containing protein [Candidatus Thiodiazotropha sp. (ex Lucinoma aequizonata)]|nr:pentapeptide repeat-containing protein [Candidatus Thiodiazotropha sp. (ex Lucinoma aequizonata)]MCU7887500.1 pentapeptide repeat-containing protein [Candidatus Thiodiazotropha sp. (ex Lucinoma aequizonata)]MCU7896356.1 pentapeptide repeat-containing protein [Candidatus Thiodiazotropha sp. (ex Lucinoma aequizonata)]MCU7897413.1 pentapeptide repeat-containing protein [Candidatus Thiodiazotropha sp. (ex Lucinoma aequizonata)]MCU7903552.1 pentapeptide repeat-containing protein [Candidatus Thiod